MPTFSSNYQIKLIGTGEEAGTWGTSTNQNLERIEQALGESVSIAVTSISGYSAGSPSTATWLTSDTADAGAALSQGRAGFVEFTSGSDVGASGVIVRVRGNDSSIYPNRIFLVKNSLSDSRDLKLNSNSTDDTNIVTIANGCHALVYTDGTHARNALSKLQIDDLLFPAAADITLVNSSATALEIKSTASNSEFLRFDTSNNHLEVAPGSGVNTVEIQAATVDASLQSTKIEVTNGSTTALQVSQSSDDFITIDTSNEKVIVGQTLDIDTAEVNAATQATDIVLKTNDAAALEVYETSSSGTKMLTMDTNTPKVIVPVELEVTGTLDVDGTSDFSATSNFSATATFSSVDINGGTIDGTPVGAASPGYGRFNVLVGTGGSDALHLSDAGAYASFGTTSGSSGHGIRENSGTLNVKNTNSDDWGQPYHTGMVSGEGSYFEVVLSSTIPGAGKVEAAHSLGSVPRLFMIVLRIKSGQTDDGFSELAEIPFGLSIDQGNGTRPSLVGYADSTNIGFHKHGTGTPFVIDDSGSITQIDSSKWEIVARAWK
tara:strand:+ start:1977 stop:3617 length:1641 start_codon:yes stop_codon:yes gene_type:complete